MTLEKKWIPDSKKKNVEQFGDPSVEINGRKRSALREHYVIAVSVFNPGS